MAFPSLTRRQLIERCDVAGIARVVSISQSAPQSPAVAKLAFVRVVKGEPKEHGGLVHVRLRGGGSLGVQGGVNAWSERSDYAVGATVVTFLDWNGPDEIYQTTWPGAVETLSAAGRAQVA